MNYAWAQFGEAERARSQAERGRQAKPFTQAIKSDANVSHDTGRQGGQRILTSCRSNNPTSHFQPKKSNGGNTPRRSRPTSKH